MALDLVKDLGLYFGIKEVDVGRRLQDSEMHMAYLWEKLGGKQNPDGWYANQSVQEEYVWTLSEFWLREHRQNALNRYVDFIARQVGDSPGLVLDWGAGTGEVLLSAAERLPRTHFMYADFPGPKREFVMWRVALAQSYEY